MGIHAWTEKRVKVTPDSVSVGLRVPGPFGSALGEGQTRLKLTSV